MTDVDDFAQIVTDTWRALPKDMQRNEDDLAVAVAKLTKQLADADKAISKVLDGWGDDLTIDRRLSVLGAAVAMLVEDNKSLRKLFNKEDSQWQ